MIGYNKTLGLILLSYKKNIVSLQRENKITLNKYGEKYNG